MTKICKSDKTTCVNKNLNKFDIQTFVLSFEFGRL